MRKWNRRRWLTATGGVLIGSAHCARLPERHEPVVSPTEMEGITLEEFEPKSMLHVPESHVDRARFPVIDIHTHVT